MYGVWTPWPKSITSANRMDPPSLPTTIRSFALSHDNRSLRKRVSSILVAGWSGLKSSKTFSGGIAVNEPGRVWHLCDNPIDSRLDIGPCSLRRKVISKTFEADMPCPIGVDDTTLLPRRPRDRTELSPTYRSGQLSASGRNDRNRRARQGTPGPRRGRRHRAEMIDHTDRLVRVAPGRCPRREANPVACRKAHRPMMPGD